MKSLKKENQDLKEQIAQYEKEFIVIFEKLSEGTLHVPYCNGNHDGRVGAENSICNCTLGQEIKTLRYEIKDLKKKLSNKSWLDVTENNKNLFDEWRDD